MVNPGVFLPPGEGRAPLSEVEILRERVAFLEGEVERLRAEVARNHSDRDWEEQARRGGSM